MNADPGRLGCRSNDRWDCCWEESALNRQGGNFTIDTMMDRGT